jgi:beta-galactosidase
MDACNELGLMTMNCIPGWQFFGDSVFLENSYRDCRDLIRRDRNHASVVFWELSLNESAMTDEYMKMVNKILDEELPFDDAYSAGWIDHPAYDLFIPARQHGQPPDYWNNYKAGERPVFIAEYGDWEYYAQNAGFNQTRFAGLKEEERTSRQLREFGERRLLQQALNFQEAKNSNKKGTGTIGDANWLMSDYNRGYSPDLEASGITSIFRIPKFAYWFYQSQQSPEILPVSDIQSGSMVKIAGYHLETSPSRVKIYSNCEKVELFVNGQSVSEQSPRRDAFSSHLNYPPVIFDLEKFTPGILQAKGWIDGKIVAGDVVQTPGAPGFLRLEADLSGIPVNPEYPDVLFVYALVEDSNGTLVPDARHNVQFTLEGNGRLIGDNPVMARAGIATILLSTNGFEQPFKIKAVSDGLESDELILK